MRFGRFIPWLFYVYGRREFLELLVKQARSLEQHLGGTWSVKRGMLAREHPEAKLTVLES
jgi:hypothetical protein